MNPYLVKELRQLTRSKVVSGGLVLLLFGQLLAAAIAIPALSKVSTAMSVVPAGAPHGMPPAPPLGLILGGVFGGILGLALCLALPLLVFGRFVAENPNGRTTVELATAAPPSAVIDGKVQAGLVLAAAVVAGSLPFQLLCVALRGVDFVSVLLSCAATLLACSVQLHFAALVAAPRTASAGRRWAAMILFLFFFGNYALFGGVAMTVAAAAGAHGAGPSSLWLRTGGGAWGAALGLAAVVSLNLLLRAQAVRALAPPSTDRDRVPRLTLLALWAGWGLVAAGQALWARVRHGAFASSAGIWAWAAVFAAALALVHVAAAGAPPGIPRRVLAERPAGRFARRRRFPLSAGFPGGTVFLGQMLLGTLLAAFGAFALLEGGALPTDFGTNLVRAAAALLYVLAVPTILRGVLLRVAPARLHNVPGLSVLLLLLLQILPALLSIGHGQPPLGFPFFLPGVFGCEADVAPIHLVFAALAFLGGLGAVFPEIASSLRAYLAPPAPAAPPPLPGAGRAAGSGSSGGLTGSG